MQDDASPRSGQGPGLNGSEKPGGHVLSRRGGVQSAVGEWRGQSALIKTLLTADPGASARFWQEGQIASGLTHPLIVPLLNRSPRQLVFPYVPGVTLRARVESGPLALAEALEVTCGLLTALGYLHGEGVTHQDIKPENVLLLEGEPRAGHVRLIDFGMSHARHLAADLHEGTRMGTPHFMAPEQFAGVRGDPRSDLYSVGVLLFDCLAGHPPYEDALGWLAGLAPGRAPLPGPPALWPLLDSALARDPAARPQTAGEMRRELLEVARTLGLERVCLPGGEEAGECP